MPKHVTSESCTRDLDELKSHLEMVGRIPGREQLLCVKPLTRLAIAATDPLFGSQLLQHMCVSGERSEPESHESWNRLVGFTNEWLPSATFMQREAVLARERVVLLRSTVQKLLCHPHDERRPARRYIGGDFEEHSSVGDFLANVIYSWVARIHQGRLANGDKMRQDRFPFGSGDHCYKSTSLVIFHDQISWKGTKALVQETSRSLW